MARVTSAMLLAAEGAYERNYPLPMTSEQRSAFQAALEAALSMVARPYDGFCARLACPGAEDNCPCGLA